MKEGFFVHCQDEKGIIRTYHNGKAESVHYFNTYLTDEQKAEFDRIIEEYFNYLNH